MITRSLKMAALTLTAWAMANMAHAEILIAPTRVVLDPSERSTELVVVNKGSEETAFRLSVENRRMMPDGSMQAADEAAPDELFAKDMVRFSPRRIILQPGERQTVRVSMRLPAGLEDGEYRSHLRLQGAPISAGRTLQSATSEAGDDLSIQLIAIRSITIPVIFRTGNLQASAAIEGLSLQPSQVEDETLLVAKLSRDGTRSTYGDIRLFTEDQNEPVFFARGIAVYTPNPERDVILPIPDVVRDQLAGKPVRMEYVSSDPNAPGLLAAYSSILQ